MPEVVFVMSPRQSYAVRELAATLQYELALQGVPSGLTIGAFPPEPDPVYVVMDPHEYLRVEGGRALPGDADLRRTIFLHADVFRSPVDDGYLELSRKAGAVFAIDQRTVVTLERHDIHTRLLRPGYSESLDRFDAQAPRPLDVLFLGERSPRRNRYLDAAGEVLSEYECRLESFDALPSAEQVDSPAAVERWDLLTQAKILINLHPTDEPRFEWREALDAIHAGAVVVSEHSSGIGPLVPSEHLFVASAESLPYVVESVLRDEDRLRRVRAQAYDRLRSWLPYALSVSVLRAAFVELVGEPVPTGV